MDGTVVGALKEGDSVNAVFYVAESRIRTSSKRENYADVTLCRSTGRIQGKKWQLSPDESDLLRCGRYVHVAGHVQNFKGSLQVIIGSVSAADMDSINAAEFIPVREGGASEPWERLRELLRSVREPHIVALLKRLFGENAEFRNAYAAAPAAQHMHHAYRHGLLEHSVEVALLCDAACERLPEWGLNRDLLLAGALLHDAGKIGEIDASRPDFGYTLEGGFLGHTFLGVEMVRQEIRAIEGFPEALAAALLHLIVSHHSRHEWGAPVLPALPEAIVLGKCDQISAELFYVREARSQATGDGFVAAKGLEGRVFVGGITTGEPEGDGVDVPDLTRVEAPAPAEGRPVLRIVSGGVLDENDETAYVAVPILGRIAAGTPMGAEQDVEGHFVLPTDVVRDPSKCFVLRVTGDSMRDAHILDGDLVVVDKTQNIRDGDIIAAALNGEVTVKRLGRENGRVVLHPENPDYEDIVPDTADDFRVQGKVAGVVRMKMQ